MDENKKIKEEILSLMTNLETQDLVFLRQQAEVLEYNRKVRIQRESRTEEAVTSENAPGDSVVKNPVPDIPELRIEQTERPKFFNICVGKVRLFMDSSEIRALYQIASAAGSASEAGPRLFRWIQKERSDILAEVYIPNGKSPVLKDLYQALLESFTSAS
jgi:hypothetical protein